MFETDRFCWLEILVKSLSIFVFRGSLSWKALLRREKAPEIAGAIDSRVERGWRGRGTLLVKLALPSAPRRSLRQFPQRFCREEPEETHQGTRFVACLLRGKRPKDLERGEFKVIFSIVVLPSLAEADEAEAPSWGSADQQPPTSPRLHCLRPRGPTTWGRTNNPSLLSNSLGPRVSP